MKKLISILTITVISISSFATNYYVSSSIGNDSNNGTSISSPWKTLSKVRNTTYSAGDKILFKRGDVFNDIRLYFTQLHGAAGNPIVFGAYGSGNKPLITMLKNLNPNWINDGNNRWHTVVSNVSTRLWRNNIELKRTSRPSFQNYAVISYQLPVNESNNVKREFGGPEGAVWVYSSGTGNNPSVPGWANPSNQKRIYYYSVGTPTGVFKGNSSPYTFGLYNSSFVTLQDLDIQGSVGGALTLNSSNSIVVKVCTIGKKSDSGIVLSNSDNIKIEGNSIDADFALNYTGFLSYKGTDYRGISDAIGFFSGSSNNEIKFNDFLGWGHAAIALSAGNSNVRNNNIHHNYMTLEGISYGRFFGMSGNANHNEIHHNYITKTRTQSQLGGHYNNVHHNYWNQMWDEDFKYGQYANAVSFEANGSHDSNNNNFSYNTIEDVEGAAVALVSYSNRCINNTINNNLIMESGEQNGVKKSIFITNSQHIFNNNIINNAIVNSNTNNTVYFRGGNNLTVNQFNNYNGNNLFSVNGSGASFSTGVDVITGNINFNPNDNSVGAGNLDTINIGILGYNYVPSSPCLGDSIFNVSVTNTNSSATVTWSGSSDATTWIYVHETGTTGSTHTGSGNSYTYPSLGQNYTFTVYVQGEDNCDTPDSAVFNTFINQPPAATNVQIIGPATPCDDLTLNYTFNDPDGDTQGGYIVVWNIGGAEVQRDSLLPPNSVITPTLTIPSGHQGQLLTATIIPIDEHGLEGNPVQAGNSLTVGSDITYTDVINTCGNYTWIDGVTYSSNNNTATHTLMANNGCDSIVTLNLTLNQPTYATDNITSCTDYTWIDGNSYNSTNNSATYTLTAANGCDSIVTLNLTVESIDLSVTTSGNTITANETNANYQWLLCGNPILELGNETNQTYEAIQNGLYAVKISKGNCVDTTNCFAINSVGIEQNTNNNLSIYPNPTNGEININLENLKDVRIRLYNANGQIVFEKSKINAPMFSFTTKEAKGVYILEVNTNEAISKHKIVIK